METANHIEALEAKVKWAMAEVALLPDVRGFDGQSRRDAALAEVDAALDALRAAKP